jgi:hypothetical protein
LPDCNAERVSSRIAGLGHGLVAAFIVPNFESGHAAKDQLRYE